MENTFGKRWQETDKFPPRVPAHRKLAVRERCATRLCKGGDETCYQLQVKAKGQSVGRGFSSNGKVGRHESLVGLVFCLCPILSTLWQVQPFGGQLWGVASTT